MREADIADIADKRPQACGLSQEDARHAAGQPFLHFHAAARGTHSHKSVS